MPITDYDTLKKYIDLTPEEEEWDENGSYTLPLLISDNIIPLLHNECIRHQFVPNKKENSDTIGSLDPQKEKEYSCSSRIVRRYHNRLAFIVTDCCYAYCRHCFRRRMTGKMMGPCSKEEIRELTDFLSLHQEIKEVLLTGGDLFTLRDEELDYLLTELKEARKDVIYRLCSRTLLSKPERFTPSFFKVLEKNNYGAPFYLMTQFNHPDEITPLAEEKILGFVKLGIPIMNQCVLLKGVNDSVEIQVELSNKLLMNRIKPYYLFQGDLVKGTAHLRVPISKGLEIEKKMREELSGLGMPTYTLDLPEGGGKIPLTSHYEKEIKDGIWTFYTPDGEERRYPE